MRTKNIINPALAFEIKTHPSPDERYHYILENVKIPDDFNLKYIEKVKENAKIMGECLEKDLSENYKQTYDNIIKLIETAKRKVFEIMDVE